MVTFFIIVSMSFSPSFISIVPCFHLPVNYPSTKA